MPIRVDDDLPVKKILEDENIFVMGSDRAIRQDIRPLDILILNLMPLKQDAELQLMRSLSNTPLQVNISLIRTMTYESKHAPKGHLERFYTDFSSIKDRKWDGFIITGAPIEKMEFEDVEYWDELKEIMDWSEKNVTSTIHICWGAQAGLYYHYGIKKHMMQDKMFGVFPHKLDKKTSILFRGSDDIFYVPHSRHTTVYREDIEKEPRLKIIASSDEAGVYAIHNDGGSQIFIMGHSEYDPRTLEKEYLRDKNAGLPIEVPKNYYPNDDDTQEPLVTWRAHANLLYSNWLNYFVYQTSPYDITQINQNQ